MPNLSMVVSRGHPVGAFVKWTTGDQIWSTTLAGAGSAQLWGRRESFQQHWKVNPDGSPCELCCGAASAGVQWSPEWIHVGSINPTCPCLKVLVQVIYARSASLQESCYNPLLLISGQNSFPAYFFLFSTLHFNVKLIFQRSCYVCSIISPSSIFHRGNL